MYPASNIKVAEAAKVTRGAVYWHFKDKADAPPIIMITAQTDTHDMVAGLEAGAIARFGLRAHLLRARSSESLCVCACSVRRGAISAR